MAKETKATSSTSENKSKTKEKGQFWKTQIQPSIDRALNTYKSTGIDYKLSEESYVML